MSNFWKKAAKHCKERWTKGRLHREEDPLFGPGSHCALGIIGSETFGEDEFNRLTGAGNDTPAYEMLKLHSGAKAHVTQLADELIKLYPAAIQDAMGYKNWNEYHASTWSHDQTKPEWDQAVVMCVNDRLGQDHILAAMTALSKKEAALAVDKEKLMRNNELPVEHIGNVPPVVVEESEKSSQKMSAQ